MAQTTRQTNLLIEQDWTKVYQAFTNADFTSYDFETLRNSMIGYIKTYYPETFNDFLESSEYLALIDTICFLGQSLAFRTDLNARENFLDTAQRKDSILKLARMLSYNPQRNTGASGLIKIDSISTTESVYDSNSTNLANTVIHWNDLSNDNWLEQFNTVLNTALITNQTIGKPGNSQKITGIQTDEYAISLNTNTMPVAGFDVSVNGTPTHFEAVSATTIGQSYIYEEDPTVSGKFNILYRNDNNGNGSVNTGFFFYFKQGTLQGTAFNIQNSIPNNYITVDTKNINNTDHWLYALSVNNAPQTKWKAVPALAGSNVIYNQLTDKNLYQINTLDNDRVNLIFGDGSFSNIPQGNFRFYYRVGNGLAYTITPDDFAQVIIALPYIGKNGNLETLTFTASLKYTVTNAAGSQTMASIKASAPQQYYTQNRMITGEDYNIFPMTSFNSIQKIKAVNRTSSGVSLYLDAIDPTGSYSTTNIFGDDGNLHVTGSSVADYNTDEFDFLTTNDIYATLYNDVIPIVNSTEMRNYYYANYTRYNVIADSRPVKFLQTDASTRTSSGYLQGNISYQGPTGSTLYHDITQQIGYGINGNLKYVTTGSTLQFVAPEGFHFSPEHAMLPGGPQLPGDSINFWASVQSVVSNNDPNTPSLVTFNTVVPSGAILSDLDLTGNHAVIPAYKNDFNNTLISTIVGQVKAKLNFGLRYDQTNQVWTNILPSELGASTDWLLRFRYFQGLYYVDYRSLTYRFSSASGTKFYYDPTSTVYSSATGTNINDIIKVLKINTPPENPLGFTSNDVVWQIYNNVTETDGYVNNSSVLVKSPETQMELVPDNPDLYKTVVGLTSSYRPDLYFQYKHNTPSRNRIDPTPVNLIDLYVLTADYTSSYFNWLRDLTGTVTEPSAPSSSSLELAYSDLNNYKTVSDSLIFNAAKFKPLFGAKANRAFQAKFQIVTNPSIRVTDNEIKSQVITAINAFFDIANWDFGDTFYFSELAAYLHSTLAPNIASVLIIPADATLVFGNYFQIDAEPWEIITSAATVNDIEIVSAITAATLNLGNPLLGIR
jgi:hypothetical protein